MDQDCLLHRVSIRHKQHSVRHTVHKMLLSTPEIFRLCLCVCVCTFYTLNIVCQHQEDVENKQLTKLHYKQVLTCVFSFHACIMPVEWRTW